MHQLDMYTELVIRHQRAAADARFARRLLIREALADRRARFYRPVLVRIGRQMVIWGTRLQRRYDDLYPAREVAPITAIL
jgi:hypothetical protein